MKKNKRESLANARCCIANNLWTTRMLLRCLRITDKNKFFSMRQIRMMTNQIRKKIQSSSTKAVLHVWTCNGK